MKIDWSSNQDYEWAAMQGGDWIVFKNKPVYKDGLGWDLEDEEDYGFEYVNDYSAGNRLRGYRYAYDEEKTLTHRPDQPEEPKPVVYIAGPMRGYPRYNFDAFYDAEDKLKAAGYGVVNPARVDVEIGFNPDDDNALDEEFIWEARSRDIHLIHYHATHIYMLPNWEKSHGATAEYYFARWAGVKLLEHLRGSFTEVEYKCDVQDDKEED